MDRFISESYMIEDRAPLVLPRLYPIVDAGYFADRATLLAYVDEILRGGVTLLQYRNKSGEERRRIEDAYAIRERVAGRARLIMNDRADECLIAEFDGLHVGQEDLTAEGARRVIGAGRWLGVSTHTSEQICEADGTDTDYLAIGPVFPTTTKVRPEPVVGVEGVRLARRLTHKSVVAIGGITVENCRTVIDAGADSVAVVSALMREPKRSVEAFLRALG